MKKLLFLLLFIPFLGNSQATFTAPVGYNTGAPTATPSGVGTRWRFDLLTGKKYTWLPGSLSWDEDARGIDQVAGCSAPLYTPGYNQSTFAVNACTVPELYQWTGAAWVRLNEGEVYTAGTGISIDGSNVISNTSPNIVQTLSIAGQDLTLSNGGGTVAIPAGASDAIGTGFVDGGGSGTIPDGTVAKHETAEIEIYVGDNALEELRNGIVIRNSAGVSGNDGFLGVAIDEDNTGNYYIRGAANESGVSASSFEIRPDRVFFQSETEVKFFSPISNFSGAVGLGNYTIAQRNAISSPATGYVIFCTDATATDSSTGVMQVWNGSVWKNAW